MNRAIQATVVVALLSCRHGSRVPEQERQDSGTSPPGSSAEDSGTSAATPPIAVPPAIRIQGTPGLDGDELTGQQIGFNLLYAGDTEGDGVGDLILSKVVGAEESFVIDGPIARGVHDVNELAVGHLDFHFDDAARAGDVDGDGFDDVWFVSLFFRGPLSGEHSIHAPDARILNGYGYRVAAGFDADLDGVPDMALSGPSQTAEIHYGPFDGDIPGAYHDQFDESASTTVSGGCNGGLSGAISVVEDMPSDDGLTFMLGDDPLGNCWQAILLVDVRGPRGRHFGPEDAFAASTQQERIHAVGDYDLDGDVDLSWLSLVLPGPFDGIIDPATTIAVYHQYIVAQVPDITGDGIQEFVVITPTEHGYQQYVAPGGAVGDKIMPEDVGAVYIGISGEDGFFMDWSHSDFGDVDGDGRVDLILADTHANDLGGEVRIWLAADLFPE